ncbi:MAG: hypothetical protein K2J39_13610 [Ruminococcus sp.]|nr:hypothetical protein [Ruminococcus sp.]
MKLDFTRIPQNSRTIIIERFNDQAENLCTLLKGQDSDDALIVVDEKLCVKSFEEFKTKFRPTVYEVFTKDETGNLKVTYSLEMCDGANPISLCEHEFYKAVHDIAVEKSASNTDNNNIDYTKLYEALNPKLIYKRARRRRDDVRQFITNALEEQEKGNPDGVKKWMLMAKQTHEAVKEEYSGSALRLLPLVVRDTELLLESKGISGDNKNNNSEETTSEALPCSVKWDSDGNLITVPREAIKKESLTLEDKRNKVLQITQKNWESTADAINNQHEGSVDKNLFLSVYSEQKNTALSTLTTEELKERKKIYGDMYVSAQQSFCNAVGYLVQKVASMEQFFIHASDDDGIVESGVIIANCSVSDIIENERYVKNFLKNAKNSEKDRIWLAVLPATVDKDKKWVESSTTSDVDFDLYNMDIFSINEPESNEGIETVTIADINNISSLLAESGILSFFNFNACEATSFKTFGANPDIIREYNKETSAIKRPDATVLAYPNFTIIPKNQRKVEMVNGNKLFTPAIYIDSAYVAAGIVVSTQNMKIQKKKYGKKVMDGRPFMRFDLEEEKSSQAFIARFNPESRLNMDKDFATLIRGKNGNAFCFRSDSLEKNAFVFTARTMNTKPVYWFMTQQYFTFLLERTYTIGGLTSDKAKQFSNAVSNIVSNETDDTIVNQLLRSGEKFYYNDETKSFSLKFNGIDEQLDFVISVVDD